MQIRVGNMFELAQSGDAICVTTNGIVRNTGRAVMGVGTAKLARDYFPGTDLRLGTLLNQHGNRRFNLGEHDYQGKQLRLLSFPTKYDFRNPSSLPLIEKSVGELALLAERFQLDRVWLPCPVVGQVG